MTTHDDGQMKLDVLLGAEAGDWMRQPAVRGAWCDLARRDPKFTLMQEPGFVWPWYASHAAAWEPLVLVGRTGAGELAGLMPLARRRADGVIRHAGDIHAEYHGWIAAPDCDEDFAVACLISIQGRFHPAVWAWNWLPPGTSESFLASPRLAEHGIFAHGLHQSSPLWRLDDDAHLEKLVRTPSTKNQFNRYKRRGDFRLERVRDKGRTAELLKVLRLQSDFRQEAIHGVRPFADNPLKERYFLARQDEPEANHFTVLWSGERPLSFHFNACDGTTIVTGLTAFDPTEARNSPGTLHLIELARLAREEGYRNIDLTPGGDAYKELFANASQVLVAPTFYFSASAWRRTAALRRLRAQAKRWLGRCGVQPARARQVAALLEDLPAKLRRQTPAKLWHRAWRVFHEQQVYLQYTLDLRAINETESFMPGDPEIHVQRYADLLDYRHFNPWVTRRQLLSEALRRFKRGETLYTIIAGGELVHYGWLCPGGRQHLLWDVNMPFVSPPRSAILYDFFSHPAYRGRGLYTRSLRRILHDLAVAREADIAFIGVNAANDASRRVIEKVGFHLHRTYTSRRTLWRCRKEESAVE